jgi:hypothetical protein
MDSSHAGGCSLIGLALTTLLIRLMWMSSPPFNTMAERALSIWKTGLVAATIVMTLAGGYMLSLPVNEAVRQASEDGFRFH